MAIHTENQAQLQATLKACAIVVLDGRGACAGLEALLATIPDWSAHYIAAENVPMSGKAPIVLVTTPANALAQDLARGVRPTEAMQLRAAQAQDHLEWIASCGDDPLVLDRDALNADPGSFAPLLAMHLSAPVTSQARALAMKAPDLALWLPIAAWLSHRPSDIADRAEALAAHIAYPTADQDITGADQVEDAYDALRNLVAKQAHAKTTRDHLIDALQDMQDYAENAPQDLQIMSELDRLRSERNTAYHMVDEIYASSSWRITKPMRQVKLGLASFRNWIRSASS